MKVLFVLIAELARLHDQDETSDATVMIFTQCLRHLVHGNVTELPRSKFLELFDDVVVCFNTADEALAAEWDVFAFNQVEITQQGVELEIFMRDESDIRWTYLFRWIGSKKARVYCGGEAITARDVPNGLLRQLARLRLV